MERAAQTESFTFRNCLGLKTFFNLFLKALVLLLDEAIINYDFK